MQLKFVVAICMSLATLYLVLIPANSAIYELALFPCPDTRLVDVEAKFKQLRKVGVTIKDVSFKSADGRTLYGWFFELPNTRRVFLYSHGKGNNIYGKVHIAENLLLCGGSVLMYDYQGYGKSEGRASLQKACEDGIAAYDYLVQKEGRNGHDIIGYGESLGSGVTGQLCLHRKLAGVIFQSGFASLESAGRDTFFWLRAYPRWAFPPQMMDNVSVFSKPHPPLLMIHGTKDHIVSYHNAMILYNKALQPKKLLTIQNGGHGSMGAGCEFYSVVANYLKENHI